MNYRVISMGLVIGFSLAANLAGVSAHPFKADIAAPGNEAYARQEYSKAAGEYIKAQDLEPLAAELDHNLGSALYREEKHEEAMENFQRATRADDPILAAWSYYNLGNTRYRAAKRDFEAAIGSGAQSDEGDPTQIYVAKLENCIKDYEESLKRNPEDEDAKYNLEVIRREIKNLMRRDPNQEQQQQQQQDQQENQEENSEDQKQQENQDQQQQQQQQDQGEEGTPTPNPASPEPTPTGGEEQADQQQDKPSDIPEEPTQTINISEEFAKNLLENLPEQRPRVRPQQKRSVEKDW